DLVLHRSGTSERGLGRPLIPTPDEIRRYPVRWAYIPRLFLGIYRTASRGVSLVRGPELCRSGLDFKQSSLGLVARVSRDDGFADFTRPPLLRHAVVPRGFRPWVSRMTQVPRPRTSFLEKGYRFD